MIQDRRISIWIGYLSSVAIELVLTRLLIAVHQLVPLGQYPIYYVLVIMLVAYVFGEGPAILSFIIGLFLFDYYFVPPMYTVLPHPETPAAWASLISYLAGTSIVGFATVMIRRSQRRVRRSANALDQALQRLNILVENSPLALIEWDSDYRIVRWTDEAQELFGWTADEVLHKRIDDFRWVYEEDWPIVQQLMADMDAGKRQRNVNPSRNYRKDGSVIYCEWYNSVIHDESGRTTGVLSLVLDVTKRKEAEEALETARRAAEYGKSRLEAVLEALPVGMSITDAKGGVIMVNKAFEQVWAGPRPITKSVEDYAEYKAWWPDTGKPVAPEEWASAQAVQKGKTVVGQLFEIQRFDGSRGFILNSASPIRDASGSIIGSAVAIQDITGIRETEKALKEEQEHKLDFYRRTIEAATDGKLTIAERSEIEGIAGPSAESWEIRNPGDIPTIRHGVQAAAESAGLREPRLGQLVVAVGEAATNAFKHAKEGRASVHNTKDGLLVVISDRGLGIPALALPDVALTRGYSTTGTLGMGYKLMISFADKIYLATGAEGTTVGIQMRF